MSKYEMIQHERNFGTGFKNYTNVIDYTSKQYEFHRKTTKCPVSAGLSPKISVGMHCSPVLRVRTAKYRR